jgi:Domain of unknown function (DUF4157)
MVVKPRSREPSAPPTGRSASVSRTSDRDEREATRLGERASGVRPPWVHEDAPAPPPRGLFDALDQAERGGDPLGPADRAFFEPRLGGELTRTRLHTDPHAAALAGSLRAAAFTRGTHVFLGDGWRTATASGRRGLLAHELAHVVQQVHRPTPGRILRSPAPGSEVVVRVDIYLGSGAIVVRTASGAQYRLVLRRDEELNLDPTPPGQPYKSTHTKGKTPDTIQSPGQNWRFSQPRSGGFDLVNSPSTTYDLHVHEALRPEEGTGRAEATGEKEGEGAGATGAGKGEKQKGDKPPTGDPGTGKTTDPKVTAFKAKLKRAGIEGTGEGGAKLRELLDELDARGVQDFVEFLQDSSSGEEGLDFEALAEQYKNLSPSERELLKVNRLLLRDESETTPTGLSEQVRLALTGGAESTADISHQVSALNDDLARIRAQVAPDSLAAKHQEALDPIELAKLPAFNELMMLQGLLAGASQRSPEVKAASKELMGTIAELRSYVLEEIAWMTAEMAVGAIISALLAPVSAGASAGLMGVRATSLLLRINRLRKFLDTVQRVYSTYQYVETLVVNVNRLTQGYAAFKAQYDKWMTEWEELEAKLDAEDLDEALEEQLAAKLEELEDRLVEEVQKQLDASETGLGSLLETFAIPKGTSEEDLRRILLDIPRGVDALADLASFYRSGAEGDLEYTRTLAFKATAAGFLLYPFVSYLAMQVTNQLGELMAEKDLGDRLMGILGRARGRAKRGLPSRKESRGKLKKVRTHRARKAEEKAAEEKAAAAEAKKPGKGKQEDPKKKKDGEPPDDAKAKARAVEDAEWAKVKAKVAALPGHFGDAGATKDQALARGRAIRKAHLRVCKAPKVTEVTDRGHWRLTIDRKGLTAEEATADILMTIRTRWGKAAGAVERALAGITPDEVTPAGVLKRLDGLKERYGFTSLNTERSRDSIAVRGRMAPQAEREVTRVDDVKGLHTGTSSDPIPIHFYKEAGNYPKRIRLRVGGVLDEFAMTTDRTIDWRRAKSVVKVRVGVDDANIVKKDRLLERKSLNRRTGKQADYRDALKAAGFDWSPGGRHLDADHVLDLGFAGKDAFDNLWPLDARVNRHAYTGRWYMDYGIVYLDPAKPAETQESTLYRLVGKWFKVIGFDTTPKRPGGRDPRKP